MTLVLTVTARPPHRLDVSALLPERLAGLTAAEIERLPLTLGHRRVPLGELFAVSGEPGESLTFGGACDRLDRLGAGMTAGRILVESDVGAEAGCGMAGGTLLVRGSAGPSAGAEMSGGLLEIAGDAGSWAGAGRPGSVHGMTGGTLLVRGSAGERVGDRMKRGLILVEGDAGPGAGSRMIAGTLAVLGGVAAFAGIGMHRGTLLFARQHEAPATFPFAGSHDLVHVRLLRRHLAGFSAAAAAAFPDGRPLGRWVGCTGAGGRGEILAPL